MKRTALLAFFLSLFMTLSLFAFSACTPDDVSPENTSGTPETTAGAASSQTTGDAGTTGNVPAPAEGLLIVHFLDVGQGDSIFLELPGGKTMLIDASEHTYADKIISYIKGRGHDRIDVLVATHPHADHIGGMQQVVNSLDIGDIYMPRAAANTKTFENLLSAIEDKGLSIHTARAGGSIQMDDAVEIDIIAPVSDEYDSLNNYSAVLKVTYGETSFLFTGDAETLSEGEITANVSADVLKVGHHGSRTSTGASFLSRVSPTYAVISVGAGNDYGHPTDTVLNRLSANGITVFRTDLDGTVVISSDGAALSVALEKGAADEPDTESDTTAGAETSETTATDTAETAAETTETDAPKTTAAPETETDTPAKTPAGTQWVLNTNTKKIHYPGCSSAKQIAEQNRAVSDKTVAELEAQGYSPCGICHPHD